MIDRPDYKKATNAAYELLETYEGRLPVINVFELIRSLPNVIVKTYGEFARIKGDTYENFLKYCAGSEHGFTIGNVNSAKYLIAYNERKDSSTIRFTIAHELGHIVLKHNVDNKITDKEANCFARNLLCPIQIIDGFGISSVNDYISCFNISEPMAMAAKAYQSNDRFYITKENYGRFNDVVYCYFSGYTLAELYGYG